MKIQTLLTFIIVLFFTHFSYAQRGTNKAVKNLLATEFMKDFQRIRNETNKSIIIFKKEIDSAKYTPDQIEKVKVAYVKTAKGFNLLLAQVKADLLDKNKLKQIKFYPEGYSSNMKLKLLKLEDVYSQTLQQQIADVAGRDGSALGTLITALFPLVEDLVLQISNYLKELSHVKEEMLENRVISPLQFKAWEEISEFDGLLSNQALQNN